MLSLIISFIAGLGCGYLIHAFIKEGETKVILYSNTKLSEDEAIKIIEDSMGAEDEQD